jgi:hypothetical protein
MAIIKRKVLSNGVVGNYWLICPTADTVTNTTYVFALLYESAVAYGMGQKYLERVELGTLDGQ